MSEHTFLQRLGLRLLGINGLKKIRDKEATRVQHEIIEQQQSLSLSGLVGNKRLEDFFQSTLEARAVESKQVLAAQLAALTGSRANAYTLSRAVRVAEESGEGFMRKKSAVLKVAKELGLSKSRAQLAVELAVQLDKD